MNIWQSGRESYLIDEIIAGRKTVEGRLYRGKFQQYQPGDIIDLRRDYRDADGVLHDGEPGAARVKIVAVRRYDSFYDMLKAEGYKKALPLAKSLEDAVLEYEKYYSKAEQDKYGILAVEIVYLGEDS